MRKLLIVAGLLFMAGCCIPWHGQSCTPKEPKPPASPTPSPAAVQK